MTPEEASTAHGELTRLLAKDKAGAAKMKRILGELSRAASERDSNDAEIYLVLSKLASLNDHDMTMMVLEGTDDEQLFHIWKRRGRDHPTLDRVIDEFMRERKLGEYSGAFRYPIR